MTETILRAQFDKLPAGQRRSFIAGGGLVADPPPPAGEQISDPDSLTRQEFEALTPAERVAAVRAGRRIVAGTRAASE